MKIFNYICKFYFSFILIFTFNTPKIQSFLLFPLEYIQTKNNKIQNNNNIKTQEEIIQEIFYKNFITKIEIGTPPQIIPLFISINVDDTLQFTSINPPKIIKYKNEESYYYNFEEKKFYNESLSSSYKEGECKEISNFIYNYNEICYSKDKIKFNKKDTLLIKDIDISIVKNHDENIPGHIGLLYNNSFFEEKKSFMTSLKEENLIENYYYFLNFDEIIPLENIIKGNLYIGGLPHEIFPQKYFIENFQCINSYIYSYISPKWRLVTNKIYINDIYEQFQLSNSVITLSYEIYHIIGTAQFHYYIKFKFMDKFVEEKKCFLSNFSQKNYGKNNISFYYCEKSMLDILYEKINNIKFYSIQLEYTFELTKEELFYIKDNFIYLNILFSDYENTVWIMGQLFTSKYSFAFNVDQKQICFYKNIKINNSDIDNTISNKKYNNSVIIFFIICFLVFTFIGIMIGRKIFGWRRKIIANELIEELNYEYRIENNEIKHYIVESKYKSIENKDKDKYLLFEMKDKSSK